MTIVISMAVYLAAREGMIPVKYYRSPLETLGVHIFTWMVIGGLGLSYFIYGEIFISSAIGFGLLIFIIVLGHFAVGIDSDAVEFVN